MSVIPDSVLAIHPIYVGFPPWISPDGKRIKVLSSDSILTVDPFGSLLSIVHYPDGVPGYPGPALSPDGTTFAWFTRGFLNLAKVEGGAGWTRIYFDSLGPVLDLPAWSRDGGSLAYVSYFTSQITGQPQDIRVWTRRFSDGFARPVATLDVVPVSLAWSQDGRWLTVGLDGEVHRLRTDGSGPVQVVFSGSTDLVALEFIVGAPGFPAGCRVRRPAPGHAPGWDRRAIGGGRGLAVVCVVAKLIAARPLTRRPFPRT